MQMSMQWKCLVNHILSKGGRVDKPLGPGGKKKKKKKTA